MLRNNFVIISICDHLPVGFYDAIFNNFFVYFQSLVLFVIRLRQNRSDEPQRLNYP